MAIVQSNFREVRGGGIAGGVLYRSSHPIYNGRQVKDVILRANQARIKAVINLSDTAPALQSKIICCPWYRKLFEESNVTALGIGMHFNITDESFLAKIKQAIVFMIGREGPYLVHCEVGIDRTGFFSMLLEALAGAAFDEIVKDYMLSFVDDGEYSGQDYKNGSAFVRNMFSITDGERIHTAAREYALHKAGLTEDELERLAEKLRTGSA